MVIDKITSFERAEIDACRVYYASRELRGDANSMCDVDEFLYLYNKNKQVLFDMFGGELILQKEIEFSRPDDEIAREINQLPYDSPIDTFKRAYKKALDDYFTAHTPNFKQYSPEEKEFYDQWSCLKYSFFSLDSLVHNRVGFNSNGYKQIKFAPEDGKEVVITKGMKTMKALAKMVEALGISNQLFEGFRLAHSQLLNQRKLKGTLCISIHPLDYITMSDNACGWGSCMSWAEDGCYRRGTLEMMNSPFVVVGYLKADKDMRLITGTCRYDHMTWNNKKWRELFVIDEHVITGIKAYPYANEEFEFEIIKWLRELAKKNLGRDYSDNIYQYKYGVNTNLTADTNPNVGINQSEIVHLTARTQAMYNDFGCTKNGEHYGVFNLTKFERGDNGCHYHTIYYSADATCINCGCIGIDGPERQLMCECCGPARYECANCGCLVTEDELHWIGDSPVCEGCWEDETFYCPITQEDYWRDDSYCGERQITLSLCDDQITNEYIGAGYELNDAQKEKLKELIKKYDLFECYSSERWISDNCWERYPQSWSRYFRIKAPRVDADDNLYVSVGDCTEAGLREVFELYQNWFEFFQEAYTSIKDLN